MSQFDGTGSIAPDPGSYYVGNGDIETKCFPTFFPTWVFKKETTQKRKKVDLYDPVKDSWQPTPNEVPGPGYYDQNTYSL